MIKRCVYSILCHAYITVLININVLNEDSDLIELDRAPETTWVGMCCIVAFLFTDF